MMLMNCKVGNNDLKRNRYIENFYDAKHLCAKEA